MMNLFNRARQERNHNTLRGAQFLSKEKVQACQDTNVQFCVPGVPYKCAIQRVSSMADVIDKV